MKYKVLAFDLDGTLTDSNKKVTPRTKEAIHKAIASGTTIVLASGRPVYGIAPIAKELELDKLGGYILACNGGCLIDCKDMSVVFEYALPEEVIKPICEYTAQKNLAFLTYDKEVIITNHPDNMYVLEEARINHMPIKEVSDMASYITYPIPKFLITEAPETINNHIEEVKQLVPQLNVFTSAPFFMEIVPPGIDKGASLDRLLNLLSYNKEQLAAFGDGNNDISMLEYAGLGIAMANASKGCLAISDYVTSSNDEDGCGIAIEKMLDGLL